MDAGTTGALASFVSDTRFHDLPREVVHETKRILLDGLGCALGSVGLSKGSISIEFARETGGRPESAIVGTRDRVAPAMAAFANGELMNALDFCPLLAPNHITAFVTPAPLALAEAKAASGQTLIAAVALAHEVASRVGSSLDAFRQGTGGVAPSWGLGFDQFGAAAGAAKILNLNSTAMADALGLAGYFASVPSHNKFLLTPHGGGMAKYGSAGWAAQGGVTTAVLASKGYEGDRSVLDGENGFWAMVGSKTSDLNRITERLGEQWNVLRVTYKHWPCCGLFQSPLGAFTKLIEDHALRPEEIESVVIKNEANGCLPRFRYTEIKHHVDAQTNLPYNVALAAHRVEVGAAWQNDDNLNNPSVRAFMKKVSFEPYPRTDEARHQELVIERRPFIERRPSAVQVVARGRVFTETAEYAKWLSVENAEFRATDGDLAAKFRANSLGVLGSAKVDRVIDMVMNLEECTNVVELMGELAP
jgi:2-methylcitrate dehydratase PrpD